MWQNMQVGGAIPRILATAQMMALPTGTAISYRFVMQVQSRLMDKTTLCYMSQTACSMAFKIKAAALITL